MNSLRTLHGSHSSVSRKVRSMVLARSPSLIPHPLGSGGSVNRTSLKHLRRHSTASARKGISGSPSKIGLTLSQVSTQGSPHMSSMCNIRRSATRSNPAQPANSTCRSLGSGGALPSLTPNKPVDSSGLSELTMSASCRWKEVIPMNASLRAPTRCSCRRTCQRCARFARSQKQRLHAEEWA